jgi:general secretion pathway protein I|tara:strand:+ start:436 stop:834 length:399 start_codon:yes stop_codon:yes gene_type:complete
MSRAVKNTNNGFTLVEVMVALLIVAMAVSSLLFQMVSTIDNTAYLRDQTIAHWVALNQLELVYLENQYTNKVISEPRAGREIMANRDWHWTINPIKTANKNFLQLDVSVRAKEDDESPIVTVTGMVDQFHGR